MPRPRKERATRAATPFACFFLIVSSRAPLIGAWTILVRHAGAVTRWIAPHFPLASPRARVRPPCGLLGQGPIPWPAQVSAVIPTDRSHFLKDPFCYHRRNRPSA
jgi:hypothetical protein